MSNPALTPVLSLILVLASIAAAADPPNVLVLIADDLGVANINVYTTGPHAVPGDPPPTPNIDGLAAEGVLFRNAWVSPICSPTLPEPMP